MNGRVIHVTPEDLERLKRAVDRSAAAHDADRPHLDQLRETLARAVKVWPERVPPEFVTMNSRVRLRDGRRTWTITLVFPEDADAEADKISVLAPLGGALLGARVGEHVEFRVPGGERSCDVLAVLFQPEAAELSGVRAQQ